MHILGVASMQVQAMHDAPEIHTLSISNRLLPHTIGSLSCYIVKMVCHSSPSNSSPASIQDGVGATILEVARLVPDGLLVFMPSYSLLDRLMQRWQVGTHALLHICGPCPNPSPGQHLWGSHIAYVTTSLA